MGNAILVRGKDGAIKFTNDGQWITQIDIDELIQFLEEVIKLATIVYFVGFIINYIGLILVLLGFQELGEFVGLIGYTLAAVSSILMMVCDLMIVWLQWLSERNKSIQRTRIGIFERFEILRLKIYRLIQLLLKRVPISAGSI